MNKRLDKSALKFIMLELIISENNTLHNIEYIPKFDAVSATKWPQ